MHRKRSRRLFLAIAASVLATLCGCVITEENKAPLAANKESGKIPITTTSDDARKEFLQGRDLAEKLLIQDSIQHFDKAISLDPKFALAELNRANVSPTGKEFFEHLKKAVSLSDKASNGEKLLVLGNEAGANGNPSKQKEYLEQLIAAYPNDERGHFNLGGYYFGQQEMTQASSTTRKQPNSPPLTRLLTTFSGMHTGKMLIIQTPSKHLRNTLSSFPTTRTLMIPTRSSS